tara:strand:- start:21176 stop:21790 length:615 start_codon:yes stop_codon:yes gene_type:complete
MKNLLPYCHKNLTEAGCDEAGRGCLSGPVVAGAVILDPQKMIKGLDDSKKLTKKSRLVMRDAIINDALDFGIGIVSNIEIDEINILNASFLAMHRAIEALDKTFPEHLLIDGNKFNPFKKVPHTCVVKGDGIYQSIAAASILAKTTRDEIMFEMHKKYPQYGWNQNKGYPTKKHKIAIEKYGPTKEHRMSFNLWSDDSQLSLFN